MLILGEISGEGRLEGGDVAWLDKNTLAVGHGYRTNDKGFEQLSAILKPHGVNLIQVDLPHYKGCLLYTSPSPRDKRQSRMPSSA